MSESPVDVLLAECQRVSGAIAGHRRSIADLTAHRDAMVAELRRLGLSERAVGRLLGISGPRVNQIMNPAQGEPEAGPAPDQAEYERQKAAAKRWESPGTPRQRRPRGAPTAAELARERAEDAREDSEPAAVPPVVLRPAECPPHPKGRVTKKFCGACGRPVGDEAVR